MKTNHEQKNNEKGNALIYVLIAIVLFAALSMTLGRQTDTSESGALADDKAQLYATQLMSYATQAKSAVDQMLFSGGSIDALDFALPGSATFEAGTQTDKIKRVYHPDGGGLVAEHLPAEAVSSNSTDPAPGWYMGRFNNFEWTKTTATDVVLVAYGLHKKVCESINRKINGNDTIPVLTDNLRDVFIDDAYHSGTNKDLTTDPTGSPICADCDKRASLCVKDNVSETYGFYSVLEAR